MSEHWTAEEYRVFRETGKTPSKVPDRRVIYQHGGLAMVEATDGRSQIDPNPPEKKRKYRNEPIIVDGIRFDSKHEAAVYGDLMRQVRAGILKCVCRQVGFDLPGNIRYFADFVVIYPDNHIEVLDAKSAVTRKNRVYINKKKQLKALWGIEVVEV